VVMSGMVWLGCPLAYCTEEDLRITNFVLQDGRLTQQTVLSGPSSRSFRLHTNASTKQFPFTYSARPGPVRHPAAWLFGGSRHSTLVAYVPLGDSARKTQPISARVWKQNWEGRAAQRDSRSSLQPPYRRWPVTGLGAAEHTPDIRVFEGEPLGGT